jgi:hypothetical protein
MKLVIDTQIEGKEYSFIQIFYSPKVLMKNMIKAKNNCNYICIGLKTFSIV